MEAFPFPAADPDQRRHPLGTERWSGWESDRRVAPKGGETDWRDEDSGPPTVFCRV